MAVTSRSFGKTPTGHAVQICELENAHGLRAKISTFGATLVALELPDRHGTLANVVLGYDNLADYVTDDNWFGATVGRFANFIAAGQFTLEGKEYRLDINHQQNHLHGGPSGFHKQVWDVASLQDGAASSVTLEHRSADGEGGYPGHLEVNVTFTLTDQNEFRIEYTAVTDKPTPVNLTNHAYFNLGGHDSGNVLDHELTLDCDSYVVLDKDLIPTGELKAVAETPYDFTTTKTIGAEITKTEGLYDICYLSRAGNSLHRRVARVCERKSGRTLEIHTDQPGLQLYTANHIENQPGAQGAVYSKNQAFCLETQHLPDAPNRPEFPNTILAPGEVYKTTTVHRFGVCSLD